MFTLQGLSFREFLLIRKGIEAPVFSIDDIIKQRVTIPELPHPLPYFNEYLTEGYYPFAEEPGFYQRLNQIVVQTVEIDIAHSANLRPDTARKLERLLEIVSGIARTNPTSTAWRKKLGSARTTCLLISFIWDRQGCWGYCATTRRE
jgi:predicted AAA+ superfamily ATPase